MHYLGVDVSKATLEVSDPEGTLRGAFANTPPGHRKLVGWVKRQLVAHLAQAGIGHVMVSPLRARRYAAVIGLRAMTDRVDARTLARMGERETLTQSRPPEERIQRLRALRRHREWLEKEVISVRNRLGAAEASPYTPPGVLRSLRRLIEDLERQLEDADRQIKSSVEDDEALSSQARLLMSVPGVGVKTAPVVIAELPPRRVQGLTLLAGLLRRYAPHGAVPDCTVLSRTGRPGLRATLYMATTVAMRSNPAVAAYAARLRARGNTGKKAIKAAMHKLLRICYGVLKSRKPFDPGIHLKNV